MSSICFTIEGGVHVAVEVTEDDGKLVFHLRVLDDTGSIGDLRGFFFNIADDTLLGGLSIEGDDVTATGTNTTNLGRGNNVNGLGKGNFDLGVGFGTPGIGADDIRETSFTLSHETEDLSVGLLIDQIVAARLTSVGEEFGPREDSLKLCDVVECAVEEVCTEYTIDFEGLAPGVTPDTFDFGGVSVDIFADRKMSDPAVNDAMVFDSANPTGGDPDLGTETQGKVLIISEDNDPSDPDDAAQGGTIVFDFSEAVDLTSIVVIDSNRGSTITSDQGDSVEIPGQEDGQVGTIDLSGFDGVTQLVITFTGSGAVDDLVFEVCREVADCSCELEDALL